MKAGGDKEAPKKRSSQDEKGVKQDGPRRWIVLRGETVDESLCGSYEGMLFSPDEERDVEEWMTEATQEEIDACAEGVFRFA